MGLLSNLLGNNTSKNTSSTNASVAAQSSSSSSNASSGSNKTLGETIRGWLNNWAEKNAATPAQNPDLNLLPSTSKTSSTGSTTRPSDASGYANTSLGSTGSTGSVGYGGNANGYGGSTSGWGGNGYPSGVTGTSSTAGTGGSQNGYPSSMDGWGNNGSSSNGNPINVGTVTKPPIEDTIDKAVQDYNTPKTTNTGLIDQMAFAKDQSLIDTFGSYTNYQNGITLDQQRAQKAAALSSGRKAQNSEDAQAALDALLARATGDKAPYTKAELPTVDNYLARNGNPKTYSEYLDALGGANAQYNLELPTKPKQYEPPTLAELQEQNPDRKYLGIDPSTGLPSDDPNMENPSGLYNLNGEIDAKSGVWTDQYGTKHRPDGTEVVSEAEFNRAGAMGNAYSAGIMLPVADDYGNIIGQTYYNPVTGLPEQYNNPYANYVGYGDDRTKGLSDEQREAFAALGYDPDLVLQDNDTWIAALQELVDTDTTGQYIIPESSLPWSQNQGQNPSTSKGSGGGSGGYSGGGSGGSSGGDTLEDTLYSLPEVGGYAAQQLMSRMLPTGYNYNYNNRLESRLNDLQASEQSYERSMIPTIARTYQDQAGNTLANMLTALRANRASGLTSGASRGAQAAQEVQSVASANKENAESLNKLVNDNLAQYLTTLAGKRATAGSDTASELQGYYSPMATALGEVLGQYLYQSAAAQANVGGLRRAESYLV